MAENIKSTILPLALWTTNPPVHNITSILYLEKSNSIVTGSESGHIIIWRNKLTNNHLIPIEYIISHRSKVVALASAGSRKHTDIDYFVSFSKDGELGLWEAENGRSIEFVSNASFDVQCVFSYESENVKQRLLFCCLKSPEIVIINSMSLSEICTLVCTNSPHLFSSVTSFNIHNKDDMILASTVSGVISMWIINFADINDEPRFNPKFNVDKSIKIELSDPIKIAHNPHHSTIILIVSACKFMIYHTKDWGVLCYQNCSRGDYFINGQFVSANCVLMHCRSGKSFYYQLSPRSDFRDSSFGLISSDLCGNIPKLMCQFEEPKGEEMLRHKVTIRLIDHGLIIWKGFSDGRICRWDFIESATKAEPKIFSLPSSWKKMKKEPICLASLCDETATCGPVTSLLYLPDLSLFVLGMHNGYIFITNFESSMGGVFRKSPQTQSHFVKLTGHLGPVLSLIHPCSTMKLPNRLLSFNIPKIKSCLQLLKLAHILWSGGEDFTVRVWDMKTQQCVNVFHCHSAPVGFLRLNHLPQNSMIMCGFSLGLTAAMFNSVSDDDPNSGEIRRIINTCMNAFMVTISEDDGISIIALLKRKLLLYSIEHEAPIKNLGWSLSSGYVLLETTNKSVYVWDLSSRSMDRYENGEIAQALMENCSTITKVRPNNFRNIIGGSDVVGRHSLDNLSSFTSCQNISLSNKFIQFQFIKTGSSDRNVPVIVVNLTMLLNSLDSSTHTATNFYGLLSEMDNPVLQGFRNSDFVSDFDTLMMDVTAVNRDMDLKILLLKIILSRTHPQNTEFPLDALLFKFLDIKTNVIASSFGHVNSKTGCISFSLNELFSEESSETKANIDDILLQLSISNKISNPSSRTRLESSISSSNAEIQGELLWPRFRSTSVVSSNFLEYESSTKLTKLLLAYKKSVLNSHVPLLLGKNCKKNRFSDVPEFLTFYSMERLFNSLILGIIDVCDWISTSAYQILVKVITDLSMQEIQNYLLVLRMILLPHLDHYTTEGSRSFFDRIRSYLHRFSEQSFFASDWIWWYSPLGVKIDQDKRSLTKIQIKALLYLALIGTYLHSDDSVNFKDDHKLFSNIFSLDNFLLARITSDFLLDLLVTDVTTVKRTKNRLISLAMLCLSNGFTVWEPHLNSSTLICQLFKFTEESDEDELEDCFVLTHIAKQSLRCIAQSRPLVFIMVCYRELLRLQNGHVNYGNSATHLSLSTSSVSIQKMQSSPAILNSHDPESVKKLLQSTVLKKNVLFPILEDLCDTKSDIISELLPEIVELYLNFHARFSQREIDIQHVLYPVLKFTSVSIHSGSGHVGVGSSNGTLAMFDFKFGKYFTLNAAHSKCIKFTQFSGDAKHLATYSVDEGFVKIWQISHNGLFHLGNNPYSVKMVLSLPVPDVDEMILKVQSTSSFAEIDGSVDKKKRRSLMRVKSKTERQSCIIPTEAGLHLNWLTVTTLLINFGGLTLWKLKL